MRARETLPGQRVKPLAALAAQSVPLEAGWARHADEVRQAQRLRFAVFAGEMGARLSTPLAGHDIDRFDDFCEHLVVRDSSTQDVVGTYRLLTPTQALRAGGTYCDDEFDLASLQSLRPRMVELGRSCVHPDYRQGPVIFLLWAALAEFMVGNDLDTMIGCASIPMHTKGAAASIWHQVRHQHLAESQHRVTPHIPLAVDGAVALLPIDPPALIRGYLRLGAKALGPPAWDSDFNTADLPMMLRMADLPARYRRGAPVA